MHGTVGGNPEGDVAREIARALAAVAGEGEGVFLFPVSVDEENSGAFERNFGEVKPVVAELHADVAAVGAERHGQPRGVAVISYAVFCLKEENEDPRIAKVSEVLPQANCGGCGYPGCSGFAGACVKAADAGSLEGKLCPVGGAPVMEKVAAILGLEAVAAEPKVAVVRCNGSCENRPRTALYDGAKSCAIAHATSGGETGCTFGCLGCGDCVEACQFDAIHMNPETGLPEVDEEKCTACGACSKACPRKIIEIRPKGKNNRRVVVMCVNKDKGAVANKACKASCIGCGKCVKVCPFEAITLENNLAYIDPAKCKSCRKCESECPKGAIQAINFPPRKPKVEVPAGEAAAKPAVKVEASKVETPKAEAVKAEAPKTEA